MKRFCMLWGSFDSNCMMPLIFLLTYMAKIAGILNSRRAFSLEKSGTNLGICMVLFVLLSRQMPISIGSNKPLTDRFNADSAYAFVKHQVDFGPRVPNTASHQACGAYLKAELSRMGWQTEAQEGIVTAFDGTDLEIRNLFASLYPEKPNRILLLAHWDTRPFADKDSLNREMPIEGANDGASGVGVLLEIARVLGLGQDRPYVGVDILLVDAEDYGAPSFVGDTAFDRDSWCLGTHMWADQADTSYRPMYGVLLDMVGAKDAVFVREHKSMEQAHFVMNRTWRIAERLGYKHFFSWEEIDFVGIDDHIVVYEERGIPCIDIIEYDATTASGFFDHHHTHGDVLAEIDPQTLDAVGETVLELIFTQY